MENIEEYLKINISYKNFYIENNEEIKTGYSLQDLYLAVSMDVDIVFSALNILPSKSGYMYWKDAIFLYLISNKTKPSICNDIYPAISKKYGSTKICIDRAMRRCFENVLYHVSKNANNFICAYLKNHVMYPRNSELIVKIVELISSKIFQKSKIKIPI